MARLAGTTGILLVLMSVQAVAEQRNQCCKLVNGLVPDTCVQANDGQVVARAVPSNVQTAASTNPGDLDIEPFSTGIIDLTFGRDLIADDTYTRGRIERSDRALYGLEGTYMSPSTTGNGNSPDLRITLWQASACCFGAAKAPTCPLTSLAAKGRGLAPQHR